ncbi:MAG: phage holin, LLH family [Oscillospiraceae bacterium]
MIDFTQIIVAVIGLCGMLITTYLIPFLTQKYGEVRMERVQRVIDVAVRAAEQLYGGKAGQEKKRYVMDYLESKNIKIDDVQIEAAVNRYFGKETDAPARELKDGEY